MLLFDESGNPRNIELPEDFKAGCNGKTYLLKDGVTRFKIYKARSTAQNRLKYPVAKFLRTVDSPNFLKIYELFYSEKVSDLCTPIAGYNYRNVKKDDIDLLEMNSRYLLDNFERLEELMNLFGSHNVIVNDLNVSNTILNDENIVLIDPDLYRIDDDSPMSFVTKLNKRQLLELMRNLLNHCSTRSYYSRNADTLFSRELEEENNMSKIVRKRMFLQRKVQNYMK